LDIIFWKNWEDKICFLELKEERKDDVFLNLRHDSKALKGVEIMPMKQLRASFIHCLRVVSSSERRNTRKRFLLVCLIKCCFVSLFPIMLHFLQKNIMAERNVLLKSLKHPFLVRLHYSFQTQEKLYFVLDYVNGGELFFHLQRERCFTEPRARFYTAEVANAIGYLHSLNIVYRDLKPENILLDSQGHVVLTDFGLCKEGIEPEGTTSTFCGTPEYLAPEVLRKEPYDRTVDWWCLGAVLYEMIYSLPPFYSRDVAEMYDGILHKPLPLPPGKSEAVCSLLVGLLQKDQHRRIGAIADFLEIKNHTFFSPINWDDLYHRRITPPYNPNVRGPADTQHIDPEFTREMVSNSISRTPEFNASTSSNNAFNGFSFVAGEDSFL
uniref:Serum/glucocorticoid regulated kinase 2a n=1 Tax=Echeneis naucrates TaxID=173247 RepID=A0A665UE23_ECHNA